jgi:5-methylcytosine-specific restriction endonuclease McrA
MKRKKKIDYRKKADRLIQEIGVANNAQCLVCGARCEVMHHYVPKSLSTNLRYCWSNLIPLCNGCHFKHHKQGDPTIMEIVVKKKGQDWADFLNSHRSGAKSNEVFFRYKYEELLDESSHL